MAVFAIAEQIAAGLVSLVTVLISALGWRMTYFASGGIFIGAGIIGLMVIREPPRQRFTFR